MTPARHPAPGGSGEVIPNNQISISSHSTCHSATRCAEQSLDGNKCFNFNQMQDTLWNANTEAYIIYDMGGTRTISSVTIWNQGEYAGCARHITGFDISYSHTAENGGFTTVARPRGGPGRPGAVKHPWRFPY
jgi:hypothetical protein